MAKAMGIVIPMVNTPHGLSARALTTTMPSPAKAMIRISSTAIMVTRPANVLISVRAISARECPLWRIEQTRIVKSWTQPASTAPTSSQISPGAKPNWAASVGPTSGPAPAMAAK